MMKEFLGFVERIMRDNYCAAVRRAAAEKTPAAFFCARHDEKILRGGGQELRRLGINLEAYVTADEPSSPVSSDGTRIVPIQRFRQEAGKISLVFVYLDEKRGLKGFEYFSRVGCNTRLFVGFSDAEARVDFFASHISDLAEVFEWMDPEDGSRGNYMAYVEGECCLDISRYRFANEEQYFFSSFIPKTGDIVIDGGAYDGMTAAEFAAIGCKVYSFEMDAKNFALAAPNAGKYGFTVENYGLSSHRQVLRYTPNGVLSSAGIQGSEEAQLVSLDAYVREKGLPRVDFIKLDVEGAELSALSGGRDSISKWKPRMAVCMYHKADDLWTLPKYIKSLRHDYRFSFRHYPVDMRANTDDALNGLIDGCGLDRLARCRNEAVLYCR